MKSDRAKPKIFTYGLLNISKAIQIAVTPNLLINKTLAALNLIV
jgi:hypothetical protein